MKRKKSETAMETGKDVGFLQDVAVAVLVELAARPASPNHTVERKGDPNRFRPGREIEPIFFSRPAADSEEITSTTRSAHERFVQVTSLNLRGCAYRPSESNTSAD